MSVLLYGSLAEDAVVEMLQDEVFGLVTTVKQLADTRGVTVYDFSLDEGDGYLYRAWTTFEAYIETNGPLFPAVFVYVPMMHDMHRTKSAVTNFSGDVAAVVEIYLATEDEDIPISIQQQGNVFRDAIYSVFGMQAARSVAGDAGLIINGGLRAVLARPQRKGSGYATALTVAIPLGMN